MRVAAREDSQKKLSKRFVEAAQIDWKANRDCIPDVNHITLHHFRQMVRRAGFTIVQLRLLPIGYDFLKSTNSIPKRFLRWALNLAIRIPFLQEIVTTKMVFVLQKIQPE